MDFNNRHKYRRGQHRDEMVGWHQPMWMDSTDVSLSIFWEMVKDRVTWHAAVHGVTKNQI